MGASVITAEQAQELSKNWALRLIVHLNQKGTFRRGWQCWVWRWQLKNHMAAFAHVISIILRGYVRPQHCHEKLHS